MALQTEALFVGATRPPMKFGVTTNFLFAEGGIAISAFLLTNRIYWLALVIPLHGIAFLLCRSEPRMLQLLAQFVNTKGSSFNRSYWKASSYSPATVVKRMNTLPLRSAYNRENIVARRVPYSVHLDEATIRTKTGQLLRTFALDGVAHESADDEDINAWQEGLNLLIRNIADPRVTIHTHVVRRVRNDYPSAEYAPGFAAQLNARYRQSLQGTRMLVNDLYLTLIFDPGAGGVVKGVGALARFRVRMLPPARAALYDKAQDELHKLDELSQQISQGLARYSPRLLRMYERRADANPEFVTVNSELMEFLGYLINGDVQRMPVPRAQLSYALGGNEPIGQTIATARPLFGREAIEQRSVTSSVFSGMLCIKEYPNTTLSTMLNGLLSVPYELVLSQSFQCLSKGAATGALTRQRDLMINAGDLAVTQILQLDEALDELTSNEFTMGDHSLSVQIKAESVAKLSDNLAHARIILADTGMVIVREDLALESAFWSMLPGNARYRPRPAPITSRNFSAFASLHNYPIGRPDNNHWGEAVALLKTASGAPYYFNFHQADLGHTTIIGPSGTGKTVTQGFLLAMLQKFGPTCVFIDKDRGAEIFIRAQGGYYMPLLAGARTGFNPFQRELTPAYELFLQKLIKTIVTSNGEDYSIRDENQVAEAIRVVYKLPKPTRRISRLLESLDPTQANGVKERLDKWCGRGQLAWVFDNPEDQLDFTACSLFGFDVTSFLDMPEVRTAIVLYLFERMDQVIDGRRFVCFIDEFWKVLKDPAFEALAKDALKVWRKKNGFLVTGTQSPSDTLASPIAATIIEQSPTQIFMPNAKGDPADYIDGFKLSEREFQIIRTLGDSSRRFLVKQGTRSVVAELNLSGFDDELAVLSGTTANVALVEQAIREVGSDPADWLPIFHARRKAA